MTPPRILRAEARAIEPAPQTAAHKIRHTRILKIATPLLAKHGVQNITFSNLAIALEMDTRTLRKHFADLPALLGEILRSHLMALSNAIGAIPYNAEGRQAQQRATYHAFTHTPFGGLTDAHLLLTRDAPNLPDDERRPIQQTHQNFGEMLAPACPTEALILLDSPFLALARIETMLAPLQPPATPAPKKLLFTPPAPTKPPAFPIAPPPEAKRKKVLLF